MVFGFGKNKKQKQNTAISSRKLNKNLEGVMKELKKNRALECQNLGMSISKMGQDLSYLDKKIKSLYSEAISEIKSGKTHDEAYEFLSETHAKSEMERNIVDKMFTEK